MNGEKEGPLSTSGDDQKPSASSKNEMTVDNSSDTSHSADPAENHHRSTSSSKSEDVLEAERWRKSDQALDLSPAATFTTYQSYAGNGSDNEDDDGDEDARFEYNFELSDGQKQATSELFNLKLDLGFTAGDSYGISGLDLTERIRQLNEDLSKVPAPPDVESKDRSIKFKETLVDFVAPSPEPDLYSDGVASDGADQHELQQQQSSSDGSASPETARAEKESDVISAELERKLPAEATAADAGESSGIRFVPVQRPAKDRDGTRDAVSVDATEANELGNSVSSGRVELEESAGDEENGTSLSMETENDAKPVASSRKSGAIRSADDLTLIEVNGKFRIATDDDLIALKSRPHKTLSASSSRNMRRHASLSPRSSRGHAVSPRSPRGVSSSASARAPRVASSREPRPPFTPRPPMTDRPNGVRRPALSARRSRPLSSRPAAADAQDVKTAEQEKEEKRRKQEEASAAFRAWLQKKRNDAAAAKLRQAATASAAESKKSEETRQSFDDWLRSKSAQRTRDQRLADAEKAYAADGQTPRQPQDAEKAFKQWLKRKRQEAQRQREQDRQRAVVFSLMARRSRKSLALARAISEAESLRCSCHY